MPMPRRWRLRSLLRVTFLRLFAALKVKADFRNARRMTMSSIYYFGGTGLQHLQNTANDIGLLIILGEVRANQELELLHVCHSIERDVQGHIVSSQQQRAQIAKSVQDNHGREELNTTQTCDKKAVYLSMCFSKTAVVTLTSYI
jgi:hypothetical protein